MSLKLHYAYQLRDYQEKLIAQVFEHWGSGFRRLVLQLPTGAGKTIIFSAIAREFLRQGFGVLVLAHRLELITQAHEKLEAVSGLPAGIIKAGFPLHPDYDIQVASVQSLARRKRFPEAGLVVIDEAHHSSARTYGTILDAYPNAFLLGVTATPARVDGQGFKYIYDDLICGPSVSWLIEQGYLCKFKLFAAAAQIRLKKGIRTTAGDYNQQDLAEAIDTSLVMGDLIATWRKYAQDKRTVVFTVDIKHSQHIAAAYNQAGIPAEHLDGETPEPERKAILERFRAGETLILSNCGLLGEGLDVPAIEAVQCVRPTRSLVLWLQIIGRALRPSPGKDHAIVIDHTENWKHHGLPDEDREWSLEPVSLKTLRFNQQCSECNHIFKPLPHELKPFRHLIDAATRELKPIYQATCPNCQSLIEFEMGTGGLKPARTINQEQTEIEEISLELIASHQTIVDQLIEVQQRTGRRPGWIFYQLKELEGIESFTLGDWRYIAKRLGYTTDWAWKAWQEIQASA